MLPCTTVRRLLFLAENDQISNVNDGYFDGGQFGHQGPLIKSEVTNDFGFRNLFYE